MEDKHNHTENSPTPQCTCVNTTTHHPPLIHPAELAQRRQKRNVAFDHASTFAKKLKNVPRASQSATNRNIAIKFATMAADNGHLEAMYLLASLYDVDELEIDQRRKWLETGASITNKEIYSQPKNGPTLTPALSCVLGELWSAHSTHPLAHKSSRYQLPSTQVPTQAMFCVVWS